MANILAIILGTMMILGMLVAIGQKPAILFVFAIIFGALYLLKL